MMTAKMLVIRQCEHKGACATCLAFGGISDGSDARGDYVLWTCRIVLKASIGGHSFMGSHFLTLLAAVMWLNVPLGL